MTASCVNQGVAVQYSFGQELYVNANRIITEYSDLRLTLVPMLSPLDHVTYTLNGGDFVIGINDAQLGSGQILKANEYIKYIIRDGDLNSYGGYECYLSLGDGLTYNQVGKAFFSVSKGFQDA